MVTYLSVNISIVILGLYFEIINSKAKLSHYARKLPNYIFIIPSFFILFFISAFRGDFNTDYRNYTYLFELYNRYDLFDALQSGRTETGYIFLNRLIGFFTNDPLYLFIIVSFIILVCFYSQFNRYSTYIWLSILMFVAVGSYYPSFNIIRQVLAAAILFSGSKYLYERKLLKYLLVITVASLFHITSLIMIFFYFILNFKFRLKNIMFIFFMSIFLMLFLDNIISFVQIHFYQTYSESSYGMTGASFNSALLPIALLIFSLFNYKKIDFNNNAQRIWLNAVIFYAVFKILGLQVHLIERLSHFFSPYVLLLIPLFFSKMKHKELRIIYIMVLVFMLILYHYIVYSGTDFDPYYFIWNAH